MKNLDRMAQIAAEKEAAQAVVDKLTKALEKEILEARNDRWPWPAIVEASRMSRQGAADAARRANKGETPVPRQTK